MLIRAVKKDQIAFWVLIDETKEENINIRNYASINFSIKKRRVQYVGILNKYYIHLTICSNLKIIVLLFFNQSTFVRSQKKEKNL